MPLETEVGKLFVEDFEKVVASYKEKERVFFKISPKKNPNNIFYVLPEGYFHTETLVDSSLLFNVFISDGEGRLRKTKKLIPEEPISELLADPNNFESNQFYSLALACQQSTPAHLMALDDILYTEYSVPGITITFNKGEIECSPLGVFSEDKKPKEVNPDDDYTIYSKLLVKQSADSSGHYYGLAFKKKGGQFSIEFATQTENVTNENIAELNRLKEILIDNLFMTPEEAEELRNNGRILGPVLGRLTKQKHKLEDLKDSGEGRGKIKKRVSFLGGELSKCTQSLGQKIILPKADKEKFKKYDITKENIHAGFLNNAQVGLPGSCGESAVLFAKIMEDEGRTLEDARNIQLNIDDTVILRLIETFNSDFLPDIMDGFDKRIDDQLDISNILQNKTLFPVGELSLSGFVCRVKCTLRNQYKIFNNLIQYGDNVAIEKVFSRDHENNRIIKSTIGYNYEDYVNDYVNQLEMQKRPEVVHRRHPQQQTPSYTQNFEDYFDKMDFVELLDQKKAKFLPPSFTEEYLQIAIDADVSINENSINRKFTYRFTYRYKELNKEKANEINAKIHEVYDAYYKNTFLALEIIDGMECSRVLKSLKAFQHCITTDHTTIYMAEHKYKEFDIGNTGVFGGARKKATSNINRIDNRDANIQQHNCSDEEGAKRRNQRFADETREHQGVTYGEYQEVHGVKRNENEKKLIAEQELKKNEEQNAGKMDDSNLGATGGVGYNDDCMSNTESSPPKRIANNKKKGCFSKPISPKIYYYFTFTAVFFIISEAILLSQSKFDNFNKDLVKNSVLAGVEIAIFIVALIAGIIAIALYFKNKKPSKNLSNSTYVPTKESEKSNIKSS